MIRLTDQLNMTLTDDWAINFQLKQTKSEQNRLSLQWFIQRLSVLKITAIIRCHIYIYALYISLERQEKYKYIFIKKGVTT